MRRTICILLAVLGTLMAVGTAAETPVAIDSSPIQVKVKGRTRGKNFVCDVDLAIENRHDFPVWFVFGYWGNELLPYDGDFSSKYEGERPFDAAEYDEGKGRIVIVSHNGKDLFKAIFLPSRAKLHWGDFVIEDHASLRFLDVWEVSSLKVNGKMPLEDWFPFSISSSKSAEVLGRMYSGKQKYLDWYHDQSRDAKPYPAEKVVSVKAIPIRRYVLDLPE